MRVQKRNFWGAKKELLGCKKGTFGVQKRNFWGAK